MTDAALDDDDYGDEATGPSLAMPPLYVLRTAVRCPACGKAMHVYTLGCAAFRDAYERSTIQDFHFLQLIREVPEPVLALLHAKCPGYHLDDEGDGDTPYLMNHCRCGAKLDDDYLHGDIGAAFWPDTPDGFRNIKLFAIPIDEPIPVEASYMLGGGEYLDLDHAQTWTNL
jgi:hypothetical protein